MRWAERHAQQVLCREELCREDMEWLGPRGRLIEIRLRRARAFLKPAVRRSPILRSATQTLTSLKRKHYADFPENRSTWLFAGRLRGL